jgi:2-hydroxychromene-2-carboxylate isomerase
MIREQSMNKSFEFFFDYVSPTAYLALPVAQGVAERTGATLVYRPMFLGGVMQATGNRPPGTVPAKATYMNRDIQRCADHIGLRFHSNPAFPMNTLGLIRATIGLEADPGEQVRFITTCFHACWGQADTLDPSDKDAVAAMCSANGFDAAQIAALATSDAAKDKLRANTEEAVARGVFGAPSFLVGDELFFGHDRLDYVERMLA